MGGIFIRNLPTRGDKSGKKRRYCVVLCSYCGNEYEILKQNLKFTKSCGCMTSKLISEAGTKHGHRKTRLYQIWADMKTRCLNVNHSCYKNYGERGVDVCDDWLDFVPFKEWANCSGYDDSLTIERMDNDKGYCPENCEWVTIKDQQNNKRTTINIDGFTSLTKWAKHNNIPYHVALHRFKSGWDIDKIKNTPVKKRKKNRKCEKEGCYENHWAKGMCQKHYNQSKRKNTFLIKNKGMLCSVETCNNPATTKGLCRKHYMRLMREKWKNQ